MGMGDAKKQFTPKYTPVRDDVIGKSFAPCAVRSCPEPHVIARYGVGGVANVSVYTCRKCRHKVEYKYHGGISCGLDERVQARKTG